MENTERMPQVILPFAIVGLGAGWLAAGFFRHVGSVVDEAQPVAGVAGALTGMLLGILVTRRARKLSVFETPRSVLGYLFWLVPLAGTCVAAITALLVGSPRVVETGLALGLPAGIAVLPICWLVLQAALRATRARMGSMVAASDRRAVLRYTLAPLGAVAALGAADWPAIVIGRVNPPWTAVAMAAFAPLGLVVLSAREAWALGRLKAIVAREKSGAEPLPGSAFERIDFGVGDDMREEFAAGGPAYRSRGRMARLLIGNGDHAVAALQKAIRGGILAVFVSAIGLAAHFVAPTPTGASIFHGIRCERGSSWDCDALYAVGMRRPIPGGRAPRQSGGIGSLFD